MTTIEQQSTTSTRQVLSSRDEVRMATEQLAKTAKRSIAIFTQDLEPFLYDQESFVDIVKRLVLAMSFARVRVLLANPHRAIRDGNRLVALGRRLNSYVEFRNVHKDYKDKHLEAYLIADGAGIVYQHDASRWEAIADFNSRAVAQKYLSEFDEIWQASYMEPEFRRLHL